jgi:hypothetical protein
MFSGSKSFSASFFPCGKGAVGDIRHHRPQRTRGQACDIGEASHLIAGDFLRLRLPPKDSARPSFGMYGSFATKS